MENGYIQVLIGSAIGFFGTLVGVLLSHELKKSDEEQKLVKAKWTKIGLRFFQAFIWLVGWLCLVGLPDDQWRYGVFFFVLFVGVATYIQTTIDDTTTKNEIMQHIDTLYFGMQSLRDFDKEDIKQLKADIDLLRKQV